MIKKFEVGKKYKCIKEVPGHCFYGGCSTDTNYATVGEIYECTRLWDDKNNNPNSGDPGLKNSSDTFVVTFENIWKRESILEYFVDANKADLVFTAESFKIGDELMAVKPSSNSASLHFSWKTIENEVYRITATADRKLTLHGLWKQNINSTVGRGTEEFYMDQMNLDIEAGCWGLVIETPEPTMSIDTVDQITKKIDEIEALLGE